MLTSVACDGLWDTITPEEATRSLILMTRQLNKKITLTKCPSDEVLLNMMYATGWFSST